MNEGVRYGESKREGVGRKGGKAETKEIKEEGSYHLIFTVFRDFHVLTIINTYQGCLSNFSCY